MTKETYCCTSIPEACVCVRRDLFIGKRGLLYDKRDRLLYLAYLRHAYVSKETYTYGKRGLLYDKRDLLLYLAYLRAASSTLSCSIFFFSCTEKPAPDALAWPSDARSTELRFFYFPPFSLLFFLSYLMQTWPSDARSTELGFKSRCIRCRPCMYLSASVLCFFLCVRGVQREGL